MENPTAAGAVKIGRRHDIKIEGRQKASVGGVDAVENFTDSAVSLATADGELIISGKDLKIERYSVEDGTLAFTGRIDALRYADKGAKKPLLKRLFK